MRRRWPPMGARRAGRYAALKLEGLREAPYQFACLLRPCDPPSAMAWGGGTMPEMAEYSVVAAICNHVAFGTRCGHRHGLGFDPRSGTHDAAPGRFRRCGASSAISAWAIRFMRTIAPSSSAPRWEGRCLAQSCVLRR